MFNKQATSQKEIASLIGSGSTIVGDITFSGGLRIDGTVRGAVRCVEAAGLEPLGPAARVARDGLLDERARRQHAFRQLARRPAPALSS